MSFNNTSQAAAPGMNVSAGEPSRYVVLHYHPPSLRFDNE